MRTRLLAIFTSIVVTTASCGGDDGYGDPTPNGPNGPGTSGTVNVRNNVFDPSATSVGVGATVSWVWAQGAVQHTVTFNDGPTSPLQSSGGYSRVFTAAGTFPYRCTQHPSMTGTVTVQ